MGEYQRAALWPVFLRMDADTLELIVERATVQEGLTFSPDAMDQLNDQLVVFVGTRIMRRWDATKEPPTRLAVTITVTAS